MQLPFPSGKSLQPTIANITEPFKQFLSNYKDIIQITPVIVRNEDRSYSKSPSEVRVSIKTDTPEQINLLRQLLNDITVLQFPGNAYYNALPKHINDLYSQNTGEKWITLNHIQSIIDGLIQCVDRHNMYFDTISEDTIDRVVNNYNMFSMYDTGSDPVNLIEAQTPIDSATEPLKQIANTSEEAQELFTRTPGNVINKFESIVENQVGKKGISICAVGLKTFFGLTQYYNYVLNYGTKEQQERLLLSKQGSVEIGGKPYSLLANVRSNDLNSIRNLSILKALASTTNDEDAAIALSALLSLATD